MDGIQVLGHVCQCMCKHGRENIYVQVCIHVTMCVFAQVESSPMN